MATTEFYTDLDLRGQQIKNARVENATQLGSGKLGQVKYLTQADGDNAIGYYYYDGSAWVKITTKTETDVIASAVEDIKTSIGSGEGTGSILDRISTLEGSVSTNTTNIGKNSGEISGLKTRMTTVEGVASDAKSIADANSTAIGNESTPTSILGRIKTAEVDIDTLQSDMTTAKSNITAAQGEINTLKETVGSAASGLVKSVADNTSAINALKTTVGGEDSGLVKDVKDLDAAYKAADTALGNRITAITNDYLKATVAASTYRTIADSYSKTDVDNAVKTALSSAYTVQGSLTYAELQALPADKKKNGYVYNMSDPFTIGSVQYPAGTNIVWVEKNGEPGYWDALAGLTDLSAYAKTKDVTSDIATAKSEAISAAEASTDTKLQSYVPNTRTVNGHALTADVTITAANVGLGNVDNTSDENKPVSTAQQAALNLKANAVATGKGDWTGKITVNEQGIVTAGAALTAEDVPSLTASKITDFASAAVTAGKAVFTGVKMTVSDSWQNVGETIIGAYPSAITAYNSSGEVIWVAFKYDSSHSKVQYMVNEAVTATVIVSL